MKSLSLLFPDLDLNQYVVSDSKITVLESQDRKEVFHFFSPHQNEVLTIVYKEGTENGEAILDVDTLYQITWKIVDGKPKGEYRVHKFCVCRYKAYLCTRFRKGTLRFPRDPKKKSPEIWRICPEVVTFASAFPFLGCTL